MLECIFLNFNFITVIRLVVKNPNNAESVEENSPSTFPPYATLQGQSLFKDFGFAFPACDLHSLNNMFRALFLDLSTLNSASWLPLLKKKKRKENLNYLHQILLSQNFIYIYNYISSPLALLAYLHDLKICSKLFLDLYFTGHVFESPSG